MKIFKYLCMIFTVAFFASCEDFLTVESKSKFADDKIFSDPVLAEQFNYGIYQSMAVDKNYRKGFDQFWYGNTDIERHTNTTATLGFADKYSIFAYNVSNNNSAVYLQEVWTGIYKGIEVCNLAIENIPKYSEPALGNKMGALYAEALTMRAFFYYDLIKFFGDVPARFEPTNSDNIYVPISNRDEIYVQILKDLEEATTYVNWGGTDENTTSIERPTKEAILGFYARVALSYVGYSQRPLGTPATVVKSTGANSMVAQTVSAATRAQYMTKVRDACAQVLTVLGNTRLLTNYEDVFRKFLQNNTTPSANEYLWTLNYRSYMVSMWSQEAPVGQFTMKAPQSKMRPTPTFFFDYNPADKRRDITCPITAVSLNGGAGTERFHFVDITKINFGKFRCQFMATKINTNGDSFKVPVLRYSDIYLMYAEACLEVGDGGVMTGQAALDKVRTRAGLGSVPLTLANIQKERAFEFAGERLRREDLIRWGILKEKLNETITRSTQLANFTDDYAALAPLAANSYKLYWRQTAVKETGTNMYKLEVYGLNPGETDDKLVTDPTGGWSDVLFSETNSALNFFVTGGTPRILVSSWNTGLYTQSINPDEHQLVPIYFSVIESSKGTLYNLYGY